MLLKVQSGACCVPTQHVHNLESFIRLRPTTTMQVLWQGMPMIRTHILFSARVRPCLDRDLRLVASDRPACCFNASFSSAKVDTEVRTKSKTPDSFD